MNSIPPKWLVFATKYQSLSESQKTIWREKLSLEQKNYLEYILKEIVEQNTLANTKKNDLVETISESKAEETAELPKKRPSFFNLAMTMPSKSLDYGRVTKSSLSATNQINTPMVGNMSREDYEKSKIQNSVKNLASQIVLVVIALALPVGSVFFALNNTNLVRSTAGNNNVFTKANALNSQVDINTAEKEYETWIAQFNDLGSLEKGKDSDPDKDGLNNFEESMLKTIPTNSRTCNGPRLDGENILASINPVNCKPFNFNDPANAAQFDAVVSRTVINERLSLIALSRYLNKDTENNTENKLDREQKETIFDKATTGELKLISSSIDDVGMIPLSWLKSPDQIELISKLEKQVVIYPTNTDPGQTGNIYLSGHSFLGDDLLPQFNIFTKLDKLNPGDIIELNLKLLDGSSKKYYYKIQKQNLFLASDPKQFEPKNDKSIELTLSTPWPDYSPEHRMIIKAVLDRIE